VINRAFPLLALAVSLLFTHPAAAAKAKKTFLPFKGSYSGTATLSISGSDVVGGAASVVISVPKNGRSAIMTVSGAVNAGSDLIPLSSTLGFSGGVFNVSNQFFTEAGGVLPSVGTYALTSAKSFSFSSAATYNGSTISLNGTVTIKPQGKKKQTVTIAAILTDGMGYTAVVQLVLSGKAPVAK